MKLQQNSDQNTLYLNQTLAGYEIIPANWGWHIHKGNNYCGHLEYQETDGWQGSALDCLPNDLKEQLKKFALSEPSHRQAATSGLNLV